MSFLLSKVCTYRVFELCINSQCYFNILLEVGRFAFVTCFKFGIDAF